MINEKQIERLLDIANTGCQHGYVFDSRIIYSSILELNPDFAPASIGFAFSHIVTDEFDKAKTIINGVLAKNPEDSDAKVILGLCYMLANEADKAQSILQSVSEQKDTNAGKLATELLEVHI